MKDFRNKVVVITGAGSGIGRATAMAFAGEGSKLHITDINKQRIDAVAEEIRRKGAEATPYVVDASNREAMKKFADEVFAAAGRVDILHNNAGIAVGCTIDKTSIEDWERVINVNLWGVIYGVHYFLPRMIEQGGGHIVNTASAAGLTGMPTLAPYTATKFALVGISEVMNIELRRYGIYTTALCPGIIATNIVKDSKIDICDKKGRSLKDSTVKFYAQRGAPPERVAKDVLRAVRKNRPIQPSPYHAYLFWIIRRISVRLYQTLARILMRIVRVN